MKKINILLVVVFCVGTLSAVAKNDAKLFHFSLVSPFGTNGTMSHLVTNKISFNILGGYSYGNTAVEIGGLYNVNTHLTKGLQLAGILNFSGESYNAVQIAGITNIAAKGTIGSQVGGIVNVAHDAASQIGGITNVAKNTSTQISGVINVAKQVKGVQLAGIGNIAAKEAITQIGTIFNSAKRVKGAQIGLINYADSCNGVQIGLINIVRKGGKHEFEVAFSEAINTTVSFKLGMDKLYTIFSGGVSYLDKPIEYAYGIGLGTHQNWRKGWGSQVEVIGYQLTEEGKFRGGVDLLAQLKFTVSKKIANHFKVFAGPVLNMTISDYVDPITNMISSPIAAPYVMWEHTNGTTNLKAWVGFTAGVRF